MKDFGSLDSIKKYLPFLLLCWSGVNHNTRLSCWKVDKILCVCPWGWVVTVFFNPIKSYSNQICQTPKEWLRPGVLENGSAVAFKHWMIATEASETVCRSQVSFHMKTLHTSRMTILPCQMFPWCFAVSPLEKGSCYSATKKGWTQFELICWMATRATDPVYHSGRWCHYLPLFALQSPYCLCVWVRLCV